MDINEAIQFCENTECEDCPVFIENLDMRTDTEKKTGQVPCFYNLKYMELERNNTWKDIKL